MELEQGASEVDGVLQLIEWGARVADRIDPLTHPDLLVKKLVVGA